MAMITADGPRFVTPPGPAEQRVQQSLQRAVAGCGLGSKMGLRPLPTAFCPTPPQGEGCVGNSQWQHSIRMQKPEVDMVNSTFRGGSLRIDIDYMPIISSQGHLLHQI